MSLDVNLVRARDLLNVDSFGASDPYVKLEFRGQTKKTTIVKGRIHVQAQPLVLYSYRRY